MHGSSLALGSLERAQQLPRPAILPRPISTDNLGRVASLAHGIPRVRTRAQVGLGGQGAAGPGQAWPVCWGSGKESQLQPCTTGCQLLGEPAVHTVA